MIRKTQLVLWTVAVVSPLLALGSSAAGSECKWAANRFAPVMTHLAAAEPEEVFPPLPEEVVAPADDAVPDEVAPDESEVSDEPEVALAATPDEEEVGD